MGPEPRAISALTSLVARVQLVDDVNAALAADETVVTMARLERLERILDLHFSDPRSLRGNVTFARVFNNQKRAQGALFRVGSKYPVGRALSTMSGLFPAALSGEAV